MRDAVHSQAANWGLYCRAFVITPEDNWGRCARRSRRRGGDRGRGIVEGSDLAGGREPGGG